MLCSLPKDKPRNGCHNDVGANLAPEDVEDVRPIVHTHTRERGRATGVEAVEPWSCLSASLGGRGRSGLTMAENDGIARCAYWVKEYWIHEEFVNGIVVLAGLSERVSGG